MTSIDFDSLASQLFEGMNSIWSYLFGEQDALQKDENNPELGKSTEQEEQGLDKQPAQPTKPTLPRQFTNDKFVFFDISINDKPIGKLLFQLYCHLTPKTAENFRALAADV